MDGDGLGEDVNGNGKLDFDDVVLLFLDKDTKKVTENVNIFDFNGNGRIDFDDIIQLSKSVTGD